MPEGLLVLSGEDFSLESESSSHDRGTLNVATLAFISTICLLQSLCIPFLSQSRQQDEVESCCASAEMQGRRKYDDNHR